MANNVWDIKSNLRIDYYTAGAWTNIQADSYSVEIDRGIAVEQGVYARPDVGVATVQLMKKSLSDFVTSPGYKSNMPFRVSYQPAPDTSPSIYLTIFYGFIQNVSMSYEVDAKKLGISITAYDTTKFLCNSRIDIFQITGTQAQRSFRNVMDALATKIASIDSRISLSAAGSGGSSTYQVAENFPDVSSGDILNQLLDAELGWCYSQRSGANQFYLTRNDINSLQATAWSSSNPTVSNIHSNSTSHYCMDYIDLNYNSDRIVNDIKVTETGSTPASDKTATNATSITNYGSQVGNFEITMDPGASPYTRVQDWANAVVAVADPKSISSVSCPAIRRDGTISNLADIEIAAPLQVEFSDGTNTIQQVSLVTRVKHVIDPNHWEISLDLWKGI
jgi:hypothetical protein